MSNYMSIIEIQNLKEGDIIQIKSASTISRPNNVMIFIVILLEDEGLDKKKLGLKCLMDNDDTDTNYIGKICPLTHFYTSSWRYKLIEYKENDNK